MLPLNKEMKKESIINLIQKPNYSHHLYNKSIYKKDFQVEIHKVDSNNHILKKKLAFKAYMPTATYDTKTSVLPFNIFRNVIRSRPSSTTRQM